MDEEKEQVVSSGAEAQVETLPEATSDGNAEEAPATEQQA